MSVDPENGKFFFSLPEGTYAVSVVDILSQKYENPAITLAAGQKVDLGVVTLQ